jgi:hypothetical protein
LLRIESLWPLADSGIAPVESSCSSVWPLLADKQFGTQADKQFGTQADKQFGTQADKLACNSSGTGAGRQPPTADPAPAGCSIRPARSDGLQVVTCHPARSGS